MKRITNFTLWLLTGLFVLTFFSQCSKKNTGYTIKGAIQGLTSGQKVYLIKNTQHFRGKMQDSAVVRDGRFKFKGTVEYPQLYTIKFQPNDSKKDNATIKRGGQVVLTTSRPVRIPVYVENSDITVLANLKDLTARGREGYSYQFPYDRVTVKGSSANDLYKIYKQNLRALLKKRYMEHATRSDKEKVSIFEGIKRANQVDKAIQKKDDYIKQFIKDHPDSFVALHIAKKNLGIYSAKGIDGLFNHFSNEIKQSEKWSKFTAQGNEVKKSAVGAHYVDFTLKDPKGTPVKLSDYLGKGKYVLLNFWASWCAPCRADIPHLKEVYKLYHPEGFEIISISMDIGKKDWIDALKDENMTWLQANGAGKKGFDGPFAETYNLQHSVPHDILVGPKGNIVNRKMRGSRMDKKLINLYGNKF